LAIGAEAFALVKASSIIVATSLDGARVSARNQLKGVVSRLVAGAVHADVSIALPGGGTLGATVTLESSDALGLKEGLEVVALFKASSVIVGVPG
jgi:molybdate transport system regulatory protein